MGGIFGEETSGIFGATDFDQVAVKTTGDGIRLRNQCVVCGVDITTVIDWLEAFDKLVQDPRRRRVEVECSCPECRALTRIQLKPSEVLLVAVDELGFVRALLELNQALEALDAAQLAGQPKAELDSTTER